MAAKRTPKPSPEDEKAKLRAELVAKAQANPYAFFKTEDVGAMFGFGSDTMTMLRGLGAPVVARQMHPGLLLKWIEENAVRIPKVRPEDE